MTIDVILRYCRYCGKQFYGEELDNPWGYHNKCAEEYRETLRQLELPRISMRGY